MLKSRALTNMTINLKPIVHRGNPCIGCYFPFNKSVKEILKQFGGMRWSASKECFYVDYSSETLTQLNTFLRSFQLEVDTQSFKSEHWSKTVSNRLERDRLPLLTSEGQEILKSYLKYLNGKRYSESTLSVYGSFIEEFLRFNANKSAETLTKDDVRLYVEWAVRKLRYAISTHRQLISAIKHFAYFYPECAIDAEQIEAPKKDRKLPVVLGKEEVLQLLQVTRNLKHRTVIALLYSCGLRIGELIDLRLSHFDFNRMQLTIRNSKGRKDRMVILAESFLPLFKNYYLTYKPDVYFVENPKGGKYAPTTVRTFLKQSCILAGITKRVTPHTLRHSYATHLLENGTDIRYIQALLGHSKPETTMVYTHVAMRDLRSIRNPLDAALANHDTHKDDSSPYLSGDMYGIKTIK